MTSFRIEEVAFTGEQINAWAQLEPRFTNWPVVYTLSNSRDIYVGESVNAAARLRQHRETSGKQHLTGARIVVHDEFHKSACLDLESFLIRLFHGDGQFQVLNGNHGISDSDYFRRDEYRKYFEEIFEALKARGTLESADGPVRFVDVFDGRSQLIVYNHMWSPGEEWQCDGCTGFTHQFTRLGLLDHYDVRFVIVTPGPIDEALAYRAKVGNTMDWYSSANSTFSADVDAPPGGGFGVNVFLRDGDTVYRTWHTSGRGVEQLGFMFGLLDVLPRGRQEEWQDIPDGWPTGPTYSGWMDSPEIARRYGPD